MHLPASTALLALLGTAISVNAVALPNANANADGYPGLTTIIIADPTPTPQTPGNKPPGTYTTSHQTPGQKPPGTYTLSHQTPGGKPPGTYTGGPSPPPSTYTPSHANPPPPPPPPGLSTFVVKPLTTPPPIVTPPCCKPPVTKTLSVSVPPGGTQSSVPVFTLSVPASGPQG